MTARHSRNRPNVTTRRGGQTLPQQPPLYAQNPLGMPLRAPFGWRRRPLARWSRSGRVALAVIVAALLLPLLAFALANLLVG